MADNNPTLRNLILPAFLALMGTVVGGLVTGYQNVQLAREKYQSDLILKAFESNDGTERINTLVMMVHTNLITDKSIRDGVEKYILDNKNKPDSTPQITQPGQAIAANPQSPIIDNARIYLLSGRNGDNTVLDSLRRTLTNAGYNVLNARSNVVDAGRPAIGEIRYFNAGDAQQAQNLAEFMKFKYNASFPATFYRDASAKAGYIEIWMGK